MWYADTIGLKQVCDRVSEFHRQHGEIWRPAPLLKRLRSRAKLSPSSAETSSQLPSARVLRVNSKQRLDVREFHSFAIPLGV